mmetsp:Transcript_122713/g.236580  ORF Transcript_122713/g.236580 Transcript_122713/m.236580 type:complete len:112 (+) Transcript_122713:101-436(+)
MIAGCDKDEVREIVDSSLSKLKDWLDMRLRQQEELLRCFGNSRESDGCLPGSERNSHVKDSLYHTANGDEAVHAANADESVMDNGDAKSDGSRVRLKPGQKKNLVPCCQDG